jgi:beta-glucanase (GH16 family)
MVDTSKILGFDKKTPGDTCVSPYTGKEYVLKMIDDFDGDKLDEKIWSYNKYNSADELQAYIPENVEIYGSNLHLVAKKEKSIKYKDGSEQGIPADYTSGKIVSQGKFNYQYGRCEIWAQIPKGPGFWPAFWSMGELRGWPWGGEIDYLETVGGSDQWGNVYRDGQFLASLHWCAPEVEPKDAWGGKGTQHDSFGKYDLPNRQNGQVFGEEYHLFGAEWTKEKIISYVDGMKISEYDITGQSMREAFHQPHYILLNLAMGGQWAGPVDDSTLPAEFKIDWIKVWQEK